MVRFLMMDCWGFIVIFEGLIKLSVNVNADERNRNRGRIISVL